MEQLVVTDVIILNEYGQIGGICMLIALMLAGHQITMHLYFFNQPKLQLHIVRILLMVPVRFKFILAIFNTIVAIFNNTEVLSYS
jgi:hypothetical protein